MADSIKKEDYEEPCCLLNMHPEVVSIPTGRVIDKLDFYLDKNDYESAERHLDFWLKEAENGNDNRGKMTVLNERIGLFRKIGKEKECLEAISEVLALSEKMGIENSVTYGTTLINAATGYKAFNYAEKALPLYRKAEKIYGSFLEKNDPRLGGLYNNMALTLTELGFYRDAEERYYKAIEIMEFQKDGELEKAITYLNLADLVNAESGIEKGEEKINVFLQKAEALLDTEKLERNGYYAFVCEKCAPVFGHYGYFYYENELNKRVREIFERS